MTGLRYVYAVCRPFGAPLQAQLTGGGGRAAPAAAPPRPDRRRQRGAGGGLRRGAAARPSGGPGLADRDRPRPPERDRRAHRRHHAPAAPARHRVPGRQRRTGRCWRRARRASGAPWTGWRAGWSGASRCTRSPRSRSGPRQAARRSASGRDYLRQRRRSHRAHEEMWENADRFARRLHEHPLGVRRGHPAARPAEPALSGRPGRNVLNAAYLVPRAESEEFVELVDRTKGEESGNAGGTHRALGGLFLQRRGRGEPEDGP